MKRGVLWLVLGVLLVPTFSLMLRPGIFTMHDPHLFRIFEFDRCIQDGQFPCRWAPDSGKGYGEPLFNFYAQAPYWLTEKFIFLGFSILDSAKIVYILSLVLSGLTMFMFARRIWSPLGGLVSAVLYVYAPYRAVDVWVRGALPEALAFVLYPLILLFLDQYLHSKKTSSLLFFALALALLINIHNLSFLMFIPFLGIYWLVKVLDNRTASSFFPLAGAGLFAVCLSAFYLLPVIFESSLVTLKETVKGYYDFHIHFTTLHELFVSRFWGYGASLWAQKFLSVSAGHLHWVIPLFLVPFAFKKSTPFFVFLILGFTALFFTHGKSSFIWNLVPVMKYIQFPWRFLSIAVFFLSLAAGFISKITHNLKVLSLLLISVILVNFSFFRPDIWRNISDRDQFSGPLWDEARSSSLTDFWPIYGQNPPSDFVFSGVQFESGTGLTQYARKTTNSAEFVVDVTSDVARVNLPIVYFPGWKVNLNQKPVAHTTSQQLGLIRLMLPAGQNKITAVLTDTWPRTLGNMISLLSLLTLPLWFIKKRPGLS